MRAPRDRKTDSPGGCECLTCGAIFIGAEHHTECAVCHESGIMLSEYRAVANETGLTPRQLADQRAELLAALAPFAAIQTAFTEHLGNDVQHCKIKVADIQSVRAAIAKATAS